MLLCVVILQSFTFVRFQHLEQRLSVVLLASFLLASAFRLKLFLECMSINKERVNMVISYLGLLPRVVTFNRLFKSSTRDEA